ncbi:hypothetical protein [Aequorivita echinoideorum]|uniref:DUF4369 domain-containing protein n=1 Tax=Aequorivita echinoideorum TaxID=1549647 RepID=A0ABS5S9L4_9FLAO|nr:hypothetical protein [Aequorivita echinoideorum]MBT0609104.1 hypothetical protein [Aequorivita echinoideorum]
MKTLFVILFLLFSVTKVFADVGNTYRFSVEIVTKNSDTIFGYLYFGSYKEFDQRKYGANIKDYFIEMHPLDSIPIFPFISTYKLRNTDIDFASKESKQMLAFDNIVTIYANDVLEYPVGQRLVGLELKEMELLKLYQPNMQFVYNEFYSVMSTFVIVSWEKDKDLHEIQKSVSKKLIESIPKNESVNAENIKPFFDFLNKLKKDLLDEDILIFEIQGVS